jgi:RNA polymerase sigma-70 factor (ECF subfamily)
MTTAVLPELDALERLAASHGLRAWRLAVSLMGNASDADDVMQQAYVTVARKIDDLPTDDPWPWFCTVVVNIARNARRVRGRASDRHQPIGDYDPADDSTRTPVEVLELAEMADRLRSELATLPEAEREALVLTHLNGMSHSLAAATLRIPVGTLKTNIRRGVARLRTRLGATEKSVACGLPLVAFEQPVGGMLASTRRWVATAHVKAGSSASSGLLARLLPSRAGLAASAASLLIGLGVGWSAGVYEPASPSLEPQSDTRSLSRSEVESRARASIAAKALEEARQASEARRQRANLANGATTAKSSNDRKDSVVPSSAQDGEHGSLSQSTASVLSGPDVGQPIDALPGLPVPHPEWEQNEALRKLDWDNLGTVFNEYQSALEAVLSAQKSGQQVTTEMRARLASAGVEMEREQFRSLARLMDGLPTTLKNGRGEWTHPAVMSNLMAARLSQSGLALSESQVSAIVAQAAAYEAQWAAQQANALPG